MTPAEALENLVSHATEHHCFSEPAGTELLREVLRRHWDVRVLDAWVRVDPAKRSHMTSGFPGGRAQCNLTDLLGRAEPNQKQRHVAENEEAARHAAALAVFPSLDRNAPNWPGERP